MKRIYIIHCSAKKDDSLCGIDIEVTPDRLYTAVPLQRFVKRCKEMDVEWAIFSDKYGIVFPWERIKWYDKHPNSVTPKSYGLSLKTSSRSCLHTMRYSSTTTLGRFHSLYRKFVEEVPKMGLKVRLFSHLSEIR